MRIALINPYYRANSIHGMGPQVPLGLLMIGGPLIDAGHNVKLINAEALKLSDTEIVHLTKRFNADIVMIGHSGSTPAHTICLKTLKALKESLPRVKTVYGGVHPTYHAKEILMASPYVDIIVRGEGEATTTILVNTLSEQGPLESVPGISFHSNEDIIETLPTPLIRDFSLYRTGWELIEDWDQHQCWGLGRAAVIQFSRGCPHQCSYCGQRDFWKKWRHRNPEELAAEIAWLYRHYNVRFFTFADENPTTSPRLWRRFLEAMISQNVPVSLTAAIRTTDICRDNKILHLYKRAGFCSVLLGIETTNPETIKRIRKGSNKQIDAEAIQLLRENGIISIAGHVAGLEHDSWKSGIQAFRSLLTYDPDFINAMYVTPFDWTPFWRESTGREIVEHDPTKWDFRHQVLGTNYLKPWQLFLMVKTTEFVFHLRPKHLLRMLTHRDPEIRRQLRWCTLHAGYVWLAEVREFIRRRLKKRCTASTEIKSIQANMPILTHSKMPYDLVRGPHLNI